MSVSTPKKVNIYVEEHNGWLYAWRKSDHEFLGQGATPQALFERMSEDVAGTVVFLVSEDDGGHLVQKGLTNH